MQPSTRSFGADDHPVCSKCGKPMYVSRRTPDPLDRAREMQTVTCDKCDEERMRSVDRAGHEQETAPAGAQGRQSVP
jgi:hypothetical protein